MPNMPKFINHKLKYGTEDYWEPLPEQEVLVQWVFDMAFDDSTRFSLKYVPDYNAFSASMTFPDGNGDEKQAFTVSQMSDEPYRAIVKLWLILQLFKGRENIHQAIEEIKAQDLVLDREYREFRQSRKKK